MSIYCQQYLQELFYISNSSKYTLTYIKICAKAALRGFNKKLIRKNYGYMESHHIIPKCFKLIDPKIKQNQVYLTAREHFICHLLLVKMFNGNFKIKMMHALFMLSNSNKNRMLRKITSATYEKIKTSRSINLTGLKYPNKDLSYVTDEWKNKISKSNKGQVAWNKGIPITKEANNKHIATLAKRVKDGNPIRNHCIPHTEAAKEKCRLANLEKTWVYNENTTERKYIKSELLESYLLAGWSNRKGPISNYQEKIWIYNPITLERKWIDKSLSYKFIENNWLLGFGKDIAKIERRYIYNSETNKIKSIHSSKIEEFISLGWILGRGSK